MKKRIGYLGFVFVLLFLIVQVSAFEFCDDGVAGEDELRIISVDDMEINNPVEWKWATDGEVEVEVRVQNKDDVSHDYVVEMIFVDNDDEKDVVRDDDDLVHDVSLKAFERDTVLFKFDVDDDSDGDYELYVKMYEKDNEKNNCVEDSGIEVTIEKVEICDGGSVDDSDLEINFVKDLGDDPWVWMPGDEVEINVEVENKKYEESDYNVELILMDKNMDEVDFVDDGSDSSAEINVDEDETDDIKINFNLRNTLEAGEYFLYAKVYAQEDSDICTSLKAEKATNPRKINVEREKNSVVISSVDGPRELVSGETVNYKVKVTNAGSEDEEKVRIKLYNSIMNIDLEKVVSNLDSGNEDEVEFSFVVPEDVVDTPNTIIYLSSEFDYNPIKDVYKKFSSDSEGKEYHVELIKAEGTLEPNLTEAVESAEPTDLDVLNESIPEVDSGIITGNVVDDGSGEGGGVNYLTIITAALIILVAFGLMFIFRKRPQKKTYDYSRHDNYKVVGRYTASPH